MQPQLLDVLEVLVPYIDQQTTLSLRLTCTTAAAACAAAVQQLTYVLGTAAAAARPDAAMHLASGFSSALRTFRSSNTLRLFCVLRRPVDPSEAAALFDALQYQGQHPAGAAVRAPAAQKQQQDLQKRLQEQQAGSRPLTGLHSLILSETKGQGSLQQSPVAAGMGAGAVLPYLPLLSAQLQSLHIKCLRAPANISTVLPRLEHLTLLNLDSMSSGFEPEVLAAVGQLRQLQQLSVSVKVESAQGWFMGPNTAETSAGMEHLVALTNLSSLKFTGVVHRTDRPSLKIPTALTALQKLRHLIFSGRNLGIRLVGMPLAGQLHALELAHGADNSEDFERQLLTRIYTDLADDAADEAQLQQGVNEAQLQQEGTQMQQGASGALPKQPRTLLRLQLQRSLRADTNLELSPLRQFTQLTSLRWPKAYLHSAGNGTVAEMLAVAAAMSAPTAVAVALADLAPTPQGPWRQPSATYEACVAAAQAATAAGDVEPIRPDNVATAAAAATVALVTAAREFWPAELADPNAADVLERHTRTIRAFASVAQQWASPAVAPRLQSLYAEHWPAFGLFHPPELTELTAFGPATHDSGSMACSFAFPAARPTNVHTLYLSAGAPIAALQQWLQHLPRLRRLTASLLLNDRWAVYNPNRPAAAGWGADSLTFPPQSQKLQQLYLTVSEESISPQRSDQDDVGSQQLKTPKTLVLVDLPSGLTRLTLGGWLYSLSSSQPGASWATLQASSAGIAASVQPALTSNPGSPCRLERFTYRAIPPAVPAGQRPWLQQPEAAAASCGAAESAQLAEAGAAAASGEGTAGAARVPDADSLLCPTDLSAVLNASGSTMQVLELFEVPLTDRLVAGVAATCPNLHTLVLESRSSKVIECSLSPTGLQPLSQLHSLHTLILMPAVTGKQIQLSLQQLPGLLQQPNEDSVDQSSTSSNVGHDQKRDLSAQLLQQPWRQHVVRQEQQAMRQRHIPWCLDGSNVAAALSGLQFLHHFKVGLPFMPAQSVLQLTALRSLQLLDLGVQGFEYWQHSWDAAVPQAAGARATELTFMEARAFAKDLVQQLEASLPPQCRLLRWEGEQ